VSLGSNFNAPRPFVPIKDNLSRVDGDKKKA